MTGTIIIDAIQRTSGRRTGDEWLQDHPAKIKRTEDISIKSLWYPSIRDGPEEVALAYQDIFEWIFRNPQSGARL
jgi:hypothetical protein